METERRTLDRLSVWVPGVPVPQGSMVPMISKSTGKPFVKQGSKTLPAWRNQIVDKIVEYVAHMAEQGFYWEPEDKGYHLDVDFYFPRPKTQKKAERDSRWRWRRPDLDKLVRAVMDALEVSGAVNEDARIVALSASKVYAAESGTEGASILVREMFRVLRSW